MKKFQIFPFLIVLVYDAFGASPLDVLYSFKVPKFVEGSTEEYIGRNVVLLDVEYWKNPKTKVEKWFVTTPRARPGTPASFSILTTDENNETLLSPYPSWTKNLPNCDSIVSAFRTQIDSCGRLWVIDAGVIDAFTDSADRICPPKLWLFDLQADTLIDRFEMPEEFLQPDSLTTTVVVDIRDNECGKAFAYIADSGGYMLIVFNLAEKKYWYFRNRLLYPYPLDGNFTINGVTFDLMDGVIGLALGPVTRGDRTLYLHSLASRRESMVQTSVLRNPQLGGESTADLQGFQVSYRTRTSQTAAEVLWDNALFFTLSGDNAFACWRLPILSSKKKPVSLYKDETLIQYISGMKVIDGTIVMVSSAYGYYFNGILDENVINYRIIRTTVDKLTRGRGCRRH